MGVEAGCRDHSQGCIYGPGGAESGKAMRGGSHAQGPRVELEGWWSRQTQQPEPRGSRVKGQETERETAGPSNNKQPGVKSGKDLQPSQSTHSCQGAPAVGKRREWPQPKHSNRGAILEELKWEEMA